MKHNNINIYVFSGTGNTLIVANKLAENFDKKSYNAKVLRMEATEPQNVNLNSTIGIGFTIAFWNTYPFVRQWIDNLPDGNCAEVFLFATMGDSSCGMIHHIAKILENKNYKILDADSFLMPNNFLLVQGDKANETKRNKNLLKVEKFANDIMTDYEYKTKINFLTTFIFKITSYIVLKAWNSGLAKKIMRFKIDKEKCVKCGICAKLCPTDNVEMQTFPNFKNKCIFCLRCVSYCPQQALSNIILLKTYRALNIEEISWRK